MDKIDGERSNCPWTIGYIPTTQPAQLVQSKVWRFFWFCSGWKWRAHKTRVVFCFVNKEFCNLEAQLTCFITCKRFTHNNTKPQWKNAGKPLGKETRVSQTGHDFWMFFLSTRLWQQSAQYTVCQDVMEELLCNDLQPISILNSPAFLQVLSILDLHYTPALRTTFNQNIVSNNYASVKEMVLGSLSTATHGSLTTDLWTGYHIRATGTCLWLCSTGHWPWSHCRWSVVWVFIYVYRFVRWKTDTQLKTNLYSYKQL